jgi:hypothetical protein
MNASKEHPLSTSPYILLEAPENMLKKEIQLQLTPSVSRVVIVFVEHPPLSINCKPVLKVERGEAQYVCGFRNFSFTWG